MTFSKTILQFSILFFLSFNLSAQFVGTPYVVVPVNNSFVLDQVGITPSFAFSTRKLREAYNGPALRLIRTIDNSQIDVFFDSNGVVSGNSSVTFVVSGTSGVATGTTTTLTAYQNNSPNTLFVTIWWDQSGNSFHAQQGTQANRPLFVLNGAGSTNQYASLRFTSASRHTLVVNQNLQTLLTNGLIGAVGLVARPTANTEQNSFGFMNATNSAIRWSAHMNWTDGNCYVDLGNAAEQNRAFANGGRLNLYRQYFFQRAATTKILKVSGFTEMNNLSQSNNTALIGTGFGVGMSVNSTSPGFSGDIPEFILYKDVLTASQISALENNQISFWGAN